MVIAFEIHRLVNQASEAGGLVHRYLGRPFSPIRRDIVTSWKTWWKLASADRI